MALTWSLHRPWMSLHRSDASWVASAALSRSWFARCSALVRAWSTRAASCSRVSARAASAASSAALARRERLASCSDKRAIALIPFSLSFLDDHVRIADRRLVSRVSADELLHPLAGFAEGERGEDLAHPEEDGPHPHQRHQRQQRPLPGPHRPHPQHQLGDPQQQLRPPPRHLRAGQRADQVHDPEKDQVPRTKTDTTYSVMSGQTKVMIPAATDKIPATTNSQRQLWTRPATASWVTPPNRKLTPTNAATATRLPTR